jgi:hypothetical protein
MERAVLLALDPDPERPMFLDTQLTQRYASDYRVERLQDPDQALQTLTELADLSEDVALVLAPNSESRAGWLLGHPRELHPHAKSALLVQPDVWMDIAGAEQIRSASDAPMRRH